MHGCGRCWTTHRKVTQMNESSRENLSCLIDDELDRKGRKFLLRRLAEDTDMKAAWNRMHMVRACLHQEKLATSDLVSRVAAALDGDPSPQAPLLTRWVRPLAGGAIAASVALMAIVGINSSMLERGPGGANDAEQPGFVSQSTALDEPFTRSAVPVSYDEDRRAQRQRIGSYVLRHHQAVGNSGFISYVPIVTHMDERSDEVEIETRQSADR